MIYFIITTSIYNDCSIRESQYINGINKLKQNIQDLNIENYKIIIIENNGVRYTFLNMLECEVYYTSNNFLPTKNYGYKELQDILDCIDKYNINDDDFIVKMTGRYVLNDNGEFMNIIKNINNTKYECVIKYGSYLNPNPSSYINNDCITGLIGMTSFYIKQIEKPKENDCIEWNWSKVTHLIDGEKIYSISKLDINICPGSNNYFLV
uniref:Uncharacterized protein n=1 Tax=viral metagenome TaxID=1070528 RepID=A0A6C0DQV2_9ZZZZ